MSSLPVLRLRPTFIAGFADAYVQREFRTQRLAGRKGTAYLFDTNSIHKAFTELQENWGKQIWRI
jgi:hypothetical protein